MLRTALLSLLVLTTACASVRESMGISSHTDADTSKASFDRIKTLAGEWTGQGRDGEREFPVEVAYRITANGSAVEETLFRGTDHEMVTMYHMDGDKLMLTHYCAAGNQPRMVAKDVTTSGEETTIHFAFAGATNLKSTTDGHMHDAELTFAGDDHIKTRWTYFEDRKANHDARFELKRK